MISAHPFDILRPFLWLFAIGFAVGFVGYVLLGGGAQALTPADKAAEASTVEVLSLARDQSREI
ncbi:MAG: hypothetical protein Q8Q88_02595 [Phenylobacterium sp.]|uniref:hypothetical protein n=1 Tax=Phenylobacterium sp. TaxID=1871053 RepID=UPI0027347206|nr:hypothetical protein [Phenylobacterium sp.]MDP3745915.1 hypothetical protein [Phenylobacterium sp.]